MRILLRLISNEWVECGLGLAQMDVDVAYRILIEWIQIALSLAWKRYILDFLNRNARALSIRTNVNASNGLFWHNHSAFRTYRSIQRMFLQQLNIYPARMQQDIDAGCRWNQYLLPVPTTDIYILWKATANNSNANGKYVIKMHSTRGFNLMKLMNLNKVTE